MNQYTFYLAGELFSQKHLVGNALLAKAVCQESKEKYLPVLPQDLEFRSANPRAIRDHDLLSLLQCDLALFHFDGPELDSGTVVEFMFAKFADIPSVIIRTDFREGGDQDRGGDPWNLMCSFYPRTETITLPCLKTATQAGQERQNIDSFTPETLEKNLQAQLEAVKLTAHEIISSFDKVLEEKPILTKGLLVPIYDYLGRFPNFAETPDKVKELIKNALESKKEKGLL